MRRVGCVHHLDLVVSPLERSLPLYRELLAPLGFVDVHEVVGERGVPVFYLDGEGVGASVSLRQAQSPSQGYDRYAVGLHQLAFEAPSRDSVDSGSGGRASTGSRSRTSRRSGRTSRDTTPGSSTTPTG